MSDHELENVRVEVQVNDRMPGGRLVLLDGSDVLLDTVPDARGLAAYIIEKTEAVPDDGTVRFGFEDGGTVHTMIGPKSLALGLAAALLSQADFATRRQG